jgi:hypothetical protein
MATVYSDRPCPRCGGSGVIGRYTVSDNINTHSSYQAGIGCSQCNASGWEKISPRELGAIAKRVRKLARRADGAGGLLRLVRKPQPTKAE